MPELPDWMRAFAMIGTDGADYIPVLLGSDGSMYAVLQGEYEGALRTVKLDDEGRISAFVIDSSDAWDRFLTIGNAELAVRLGSPVAYDRRGQVHLFEDFENGIHRWQELTSGSGAAIALDPTTAAAGGYSVKLTPGTTVNKYAYLLYRRGTLPIGRVGMEFSFALPGACQWVFGSLFVDDGTALYECKFRWLDSDNGLYINDSDLGMTLVGTDPLVGLNKQRYNTIKVVIDLPNEEWVRLLFNQQEIDISAHPMEGIAPGAAPRISMEVGVYGTGAAGQDVYIDDVILTFGEP